MERGKVSCNMTPSDALRDFVLPIPAILGSVGLEVLVPRKGTLPLGNTARVSLNYCYCLGFYTLSPKRPTGKKRNHYSSRNN